MKDLFAEIWGDIRRNKLRTCLTGFAVSWGIFMLIVLLGAGNGLMNAFLRDSNNISVNTMRVWGEFTSKPYNGLKEGRRIILKDKDLEITGGPAFSNVIDEVTANLDKRDETMTFKGRHLNAYMNGTFPGEATMNGRRIIKGRFINEKDITEERKVIILPSNQAKALYDNAPDWENIVGQRIRVGNNSFLVAGIYKSDGTYMYEDSYVPYSTLKKIYNLTEVGSLSFSFHGLDTEEDNEAFEKRYKSVVNLAHMAAPDDESTLWINNRYVQNIAINKATRILNIALWLLGIFTLLSGIVGVSNIMLITVKERTHEFGIRKALGASPAAIIRLILSESISITAIFGYIGMMFGLLGCEWLNIKYGHSTVDVLGMSVSVLKNPSVGIDVAFGATLLLICAGTVAGFFPALKASKVRPIEALRAE